MALDTRPARQLSSREISKLFGAFIGGLVSNGWCRIKDVFDAIDHIHGNREMYEAVFKTGATKETLQ